MSSNYFVPVDDKVLVVHRREDRVGPNRRLTFNNGSDLPPFPKSVDKVTFSWLATENEEVILSYKIVIVTPHC